MIESKGKAFRRLLKDEPYVFTGGVYSPLDAQIAEKVASRRSTSAGIRSPWPTGGRTWGS